MYLYIAQVIREGRYIQTTIGNGSGYDDTSNLHRLIFPSESPAARTIVHESTHAVIDATHKGKQIVKGVNEAAAFLAEAIYGMYTGESMDGYPGYFAHAVHRLAEQVHEFNVKHASGLFVCPSGDVMNLRALIAGLPLMYGTANQVETMKGIGDGA